VLKTKKDFSKMTTFFTFTKFNERRKLF